MMPFTQSSLLLALIALSAEAAAAVPATAPGACSWDRPGQNPFMGDLVAAVDRYQDIPAPVRARLKTRMAERAYDEIVSIGRDRIVGRARYGAEIRDMHFGSGQVCGTVNRAGWDIGMQERGLVYCEANHCILVPTVCRNVSRITREAPAMAGTAGAGGAAGGGGGVAGGGAPATPDGNESTTATAATADTAQAAGSAGAAGSGGETLASAGGTPTAADLGAGGGTATAPTPGAVAAPDSWIAALGLGGVMAATPDASNPGGTALPLGAHGTPANDLADSGSLQWRPSTDELPAGGPWTGGIDQPTAAVPEPGTWALMIGGLVGLAALARRRARVCSV
jgi:hypothetical protein